MRCCIFRSIVLICTLGLASHASAQSSTPSASSSSTALSPINVDDETSTPLDRAFVDEAKLSVRLTPGVYFTRLSGDGGFGGTDITDSIDFEDDVDLRDSEATPNFEADIRIDRLQFRLMYQDFSTEGASDARRAFRFGELSFATGDRIRASFDQQFLMGEVGYAFNLIDEDNLRMFIRPVAGVRYIDSELEVESIRVTGSSTRTGSVETVVVHGGARLEIAMWDEFIVRGGANVGTSFDGGFVVGVAADMTWYPDKGNLGLTAGYRLIYATDLEGDDDFELDSRLGGMFIGGSLRF